jgi:hypothetical protein
MGKIYLYSWVCYIRSKKNVVWVRHTVLKTCSREFNLVHRAFVRKYIRMKIFIPTCLSMQGCGILCVAKIRDKKQRHIL